MRRLEEFLLITGVGLVVAGLTRPSTAFLVAGALTFAAGAALDFLYLCRLNKRASRLLSDEDRAQYDLYPEAMRDVMPMAGKTRLP